MKEQGREKPKSVEVGSRWTNNCGDFATVVRQCDARVILRWDTGDETDPTPDVVLCLLTYLGGPSPSPEGVGRVMEANERGYPVACLQCGGRVPRVRSFVCVDCFPQPNGISDAMALEWKGGARDFPRSPAPVPVAPKPAAVECTFTYGGQHCQMLNEHKDHICGADPGFRIPVAAAEREAAMVRPHDGTMSALQAIRSRPKPEPWVPSIDEWDLLPDAGR